MKPLFLIIFSCVLAVTGVMWNGYCLQTGWNWFNSEMNLPNMTLKFAMFFMVMCRYCSSHISGVKDNRDSSDKLGEAIAYTYFVPAFFLGIAYLIQRYA